MVDGLSIIMPARNEAAVIAETLQRLLLVSLPSPCEVIVVNDYSTDSTREVAEHWVEQVYPNTGIPGYGSAIRLGLRRAHFSHVTIMTADGSDAPEDLLKMWGWRDRQMVFGDRWTGGATVGYPFLKYCLNQLGNIWLAKQTRTQYFDWTNPFKLYQTSEIRKILPLLKSPDLSAGLEVALRMWQLHPQFSVVPHHWQERRAGQSKFKLLQHSHLYYQTARRILG